VMETGAVRTNGFLLPSRTGTESRPCQHSAVRVGRSKCSEDSGFSPQSGVQLCQSDISQAAAGHLRKSYLRFVKLRADLQASEEHIVSFFRAEDRVSMFLRNVDISLLVQMLFLTRTRTSTASEMKRRDREAWQPQSEFSSC
jgi:hypothetical protein